MSENPTSLHRQIEAAKQLRLQIAMMVAGEAQQDALTADDIQAINDTFEGETTLDVELGRAILAEDEDLIFVDGIDKRLQELSDRKTRIKKRIDARRGLMHQAMAIAEWSKRETPYGTVSLGKGGVSTVVDDEFLVPSIYWKPQDPVLSKTDLGAALKAFKKEIEAALKIKDDAERATALAGLVARLPASDMLSFRQLEASGINDPHERCEALAIILANTSPVPGAHLEQSGASIGIRRK